jgi:hypothetical protein
MKAKKNFHNFFFFCDMTFRNVFFCNRLFVIVVPKYLPRFEKIPTSVRTPARPWLRSVKRQTKLIAVGSFIFGCQVKCPRLQPEKSKQKLQVENSRSKRQTLQSVA